MYFYVTNSLLFWSFRLYPALISFTFFPFSSSPSSSFAGWGPNPEILASLFNVKSIFLAASLRCTIYKSMDICNKQGRIQDFRLGARTIFVDFWAVSNHIKRLRYSTNKYTYQYFLITPGCTLKFYIYM